MITTHSNENFLLMIINFKRKKKSILIVSPFQMAGDFIEEDKRPPVPFVFENEDPLNLSVAEWQRNRSGSIQGVLGRLSILYWGIFFFYYHQQGTGQADYFPWKLYSNRIAPSLCIATM